MQGEDSIRRTVENPGEDERQLEARDVTLAFYRVDALARDSDGLGKLLLGPASVSAELFNSVLYSPMHVKLAFPNNLEAIDTNVK